MKKGEKSVADHMHKEELIHIIKKSGCDMLDDLPLGTMKKEDIIIHLENSCCPELKALTHCRK